MIKIKRKRSRATKAAAVPMKRQSIDGPSTLYTMGPLESAVFRLESLKAAKYRSATKTHAASHVADVGSASMTPSADADMLEAGAAISKAMARIDSDGPDFYTPEVLRLQGEIVAGGGPGAQLEAESWLMRHGTESRLTVI